MNQVKKNLYDLLLAGYNQKPNFTLARTLYLFCQDNEGFSLPREVEQTFVEGLREQEFRAFCLASKKSSGPVDPLERKRAIVRKMLKGEPRGSEEQKREKMVAMLTEGTGKAYTPQMVETLDPKYKSTLTYNDVLEIFILKGNASE